MRPDSVPVRRLCRTGGLDQSACFASDVLLGHTLAGCGSHVSDARWGHLAVAARGKGQGSLVVLPSRACSARPAAELMRTSGESWVQLVLCSFRQEAEMMSASVNLRARRSVVAAREGSQTRALSDAKVEAEEACCDEAQSYPQ